MNEPCTTCCQLRDNLIQALQERAFTAQQAEDVPSHLLIHRHLQAEEAVHSAAAAMDAHRAEHRPVAS